MELVGGRYLEIGVTEDLLALFGEPCFGIPKLLLIEARMAERLYKFEYEEARGLLREPVRIVADE